MVPQKFELPSEDRLYKVVQLYLSQDHQEVPYMAFGKDHILFESVLEHFLRRWDFEFGFEDRDGFVEPVPKLGGRSDWYEVVGMGYADKQETTIDFYGGSEDFGLSIHNEHLVDLGGYVGGYSLRKRED